MIQDVAAWKAKCRADALEEAAALCESESTILYTLSCTPRSPNGPENSAASHDLRRVADLIRALAPSEK